MEGIKGLYLEGKQSSFRAKLLALYILSLPLGTVNIPIGGSMLRYIALLPILINIAWIIIVKQIRFNRIHILYFLYFVIMMASLFFSINFEVSLERLTTNFLFILLLTTATLLPYSENEVKMIKKSYVWAARITALFTLLLGSNVDGERFTLHNDIFVEDPNYLVGYFIFAILFGMDSVINKKGGLSEKLKSILELVVYIYIIIISGSRGGAAGAALAILAYFTINFHISKKKVKTMIIILMLVLVSVFAIQLVINNAPRSVLERFSIDEIIESKGTGRFLLWETAINIFKNSSLHRQIVGYGAGTIRFIGVSGYFMWKVAHNLWLEILLELGIAGLIAFFLINYYCLAAAFRKKEAVLLAAFVGMMGLTMSLSLQAYKPLWNLIIILCLYTADLNVGINDERAGAGDVQLDKSISQIE